MTPENEALIAEAERYIVATFDNSAHEARMLSGFIAALRAAEAENAELRRQRGHFIRQIAERDAWIANPPKHDYWGAGEPDCPREIKAGNGELHTLRCRVCGLDNPRDKICRALGGSND